MLLSRKLKKTSLVQLKVELMGETPKEMLISQMTASLCFWEQEGQSMYGPCPFLPNPWPGELMVGDSPRGGDFEG